MYVYIHQHTARAHGVTPKFECCENCGCEWVYLMRRSALAKKATLYGIGADAAQQRANSRANKMLREILRSDVDAIPCPRCGWYQRAMWTKRRMQLFKLVCAWMALPLSVLVLAYPVARKNWIPEHPMTWAVLWGVFAVALGLLCVWVFSRDINAAARFGRSNGIAIESDSIMLRETYDKRISAMHPAAQGREDG
jgi:hypothetical protein